MDNIIKLAPERNNQTKCFQRRVGLLVQRRHDTRIVYLRDKQIQFKLAVQDFFQIYSHSDQHFDVWKNGAGCLLEEHYC